MSEKKDNGPVAYGRGIAIGTAMTLITCKYFPKDASWWQDALLGIVRALVVIITPVIWLPSPKKTDRENEIEEKKQGNKKRKS